MYFSKTRLLFSSVWENLTRHNRDHYDSFIFNYPGKLLGSFRLQKSLFSYGGCMVLAHGVYICTNYNAVYISNSQRFADSWKDALVQLWTMSHSHKPVQDHSTPSRVPVIGQSHIIMIIVHPHLWWTSGQESVHTQVRGPMSAYKEPPFMDETSQCPTNTCLSILKEIIYTSLHAGPFHCCSTFWPGRLSYSCLKTIPLLSQGNFSYCSLTTTKNTRPCLTL